MEVRRPRRAVVWGRRAVAVLVAVDLVAGAGTLVLRSRDEADPVSVGRAVARFRAEPAAGDAPDAPPGPAPSSSVPGEARPPVAESSSSPSTSTAGTSGSAPPEPVRPAGGAETAPSTAAQPPVGVYAYDTDGYEETDALGGARHDYPERTAVTVREAGCGRSLRWDVLEQRSDTIELCPLLGGGSSIASWESRHEFFGRRDERVLRCEPGSRYLPAPGTAPGTAWTYRCSAETTDRLTSTTLVGRETLSVGGVAVPVVHLRERSTGGGDSTGVAVRELWLRETDGLLVRERTDVDMTTQAGAIRARYRERYELQLIDLEPQR